MKESDLQRVFDNMLQEGISKYIVAGISLQFSAGLRISDLLKLTYRDISSNLLITVLQSKGSNALVVQPIYFRDVWREVREEKLAPFQFYDRFVFYRISKRYGLIISNGKGRNNSVTHAGRKYLAREMYSASNDIHTAKEALGHKSANSTKYYVDKDYRKSVLSRGIGNNVSGEVSNVVVQKNGVIRIARLPKRKRK